MRIFYSVLFFIITWGLNAQKDWKGIELKMEILTNKQGEIDPILLKIALRNTKRAREIPPWNSDNFYLQYREVKSERWRKLAFYEIHSNSHYLKKFRFPRKGEIVRHVSTYSTNLKVGKQYEFMLVYHLDDGARDNNVLNCEKCIYSKIYIIDIVDYSGINNMAYSWLKRQKIPFIFSGLELDMGALNYKEVNKLIKDFINEFPRSKFFEWAILHYCGLNYSNDNLKIRNDVTEKLKEIIKTTSTIQTKQKAESLLRIAQGY